MVAATPSGIEEIVRDQHTPAARIFHSGKYVCSLKAESYDAEQGNLKIGLYPRAATKADHTVASFVVDDIEGTAKTLRTRGVTFEDYDFPGLKTVDGIATLATEKAAWFKDTEGNILAVSQFI